MRDYVQMKLIISNTDKYKPFQPEYKCMCCDVCKCVCQCGSCSDNQKSFVFYNLVKLLITSKFYMSLDPINSHS